MAADFFVSPHGYIAFHVNGVLTNIAPRTKNLKFTIRACQKAMLSISTDSQSDNVY